MLRAFDKHNDDFRKRVGKDRAPHSALSYCIVRNHVANFIESYYKRKDMVVEMASPLSISVTAVENNIRKLKEKGIVSRVGSDKTGHWEIV